MRKQMMASGRVPLWVPQAGEPLGGNLIPFFSEGPLRRQLEGECVTFGSGSSGTAELLSPASPDSSLGDPGRATGLL